MITQKHHEPQEWFHVTEIFTDEELAIIDSNIPQQPLDIHGKRDNNSSARSFVNLNSNHELLSVFSHFDSSETRERFTNLTGVDCSTGRLRIEIVNDAPGTHLEKHVDIKEKLITLQIYINKGEYDWGTTIWHDLDTKFYTVPFQRNTGWLTHRNADVIHGVQENRVTANRHSVIINYIDGDWRDTDQLFHLT